MSSDLLFPGLFEFPGIGKFPGITYNSREFPEIMKNLRFRLLAVVWPMNLTILHINLTILPIDIVVYRVKILFFFDTKGTQKVNKGYKMNLMVSWTLSWHKEV